MCFRNLSVCGCEMDLVCESKGWGTHFIFYGVVVWDCALASIF